MRRLGSTLLCVFLTILSIHPAQADHRSAMDLDDSPSALDISSIRHGHAYRGVLVHRIETYEPWDNALLESYYNSFTLGLQYGPNFRRFRYINIDAAPDGSLSGEINHPREGRVLGYAKVWRTDDRSFKVAFPQRILSKDLRVYKWTVASSFHDDQVAECSSDGEGHVISCADRAPDGRLIRHKL
jgi:hypothetical protein